MNRILVNMFLPIVGAAIGAAVLAYNPELFNAICVQ